MLGPFELAIGVVVAYVVVGADDNLGEGVVESEIVVCAFGEEYFADELPSVGEDEEVVGVGEVDVGFGDDEAVGAAYVGFGGSLEGNETNVGDGGLEVELFDVEERVDVDGGCGGCVGGEGFSFLRVEALVLLVSARDGVVGLFGAGRREEYSYKQR